MNNLVSSSSSKYFTGYCYRNHSESIDLECTSNKTLFQICDVIKQSSLFLNNILVHFSKLKI